MNKKLIYPELSFEVIGVAFKVFNELGYGYQEKYYQKAFALELNKRKINYEKELLVALKYDNKKIGKYFIDFLIKGKIVLEIKVGREFHYRDTKQILSYLESKEAKLGILILISPSGIKYKRVINNKI